MRAALRLSLEADATGGMDLPMREEAGAIMRSIASRLLRSALADGPPVRLTSKKHRATIVAHGY
jgi:hypothetical protein